MGRVVSTKAINSSSIALVVAVITKEVGLCMEWFFPSNDSFCSLIGTAVFVETCVGTLTPQGKMFTELLNGQSSWWEGISGL